MKFREHEQNRNWIVDALKSLESFVLEDRDFRGNKHYESKAVGDQRRFIEEGKYRVVFLGTFNVGKSTAVNAFLGGAYLPMDVEECTSKLTFIQRGEDMRLLINLHEMVSENELKALDKCFKDIPAKLSAETDGRRLTVLFESENPDAMRRTLEPLVTVLADEEFPHLAPLRDKIEELNLFLPSSVLEEDIAFVDTPGVHSVSETRQEITYGIIERSHLVISFVDSGFAGNIHDLNFIKRIIKWRGRRVFFVLNKADKLETDEIDIRGARGPAKSLTLAFQRHDIPEDSEIFFLSGYRALRAQQLSKGQIELDEVLADNKISIPTSVGERLEDTDDPAADLSAYLMGQSRFPHLKERLLDYLLNENKAGAVVEAAAKFIAERAENFALPLDHELKLARDPSKFEELRRNRESLMKKLREIRANADRVLNEYNARSKGGRVGDTDYPGYEKIFRNKMGDELVKSKIVAELLKWLREGDNLKDARSKQFKPLAAQVEHQVDEFISSLLQELNNDMDQAELEVQEAVAEQLGKLKGLRLQMMSSKKLKMSEVEANNMAGSYMAFSAGGALIGAATGAAFGSIVPVIGTAIGAGVGSLFGAMGGFLTRLAWSDERWIKKLEPIIRENVMNILIHGGKDEEGKRTTPIIESVVKYLKERSDTFYTTVQGEVDNSITSVQKECDDLLAREEEIRRESEEIIARLEPKVHKLHEVREKALLVVEDANRETVRV